MQQDNEECTCCEQTVKFWASTPCKFSVETITDLGPPDSNLNAFNLVTFNAGYEINGECNQKRLLQFLMQEDPPHVVCLQEMMTQQIDPLLSILNAKGAIFPWRYCARSPHSRSTILSAFPITRVTRGQNLSPKNERQGNNEFLTVRIQGTYITSLHLSSRREGTRLNQIHKIERKLEKAGVWGLEEPHIWAGDFNSLTKKDYDEEGWSNIEEQRRGSSREVAELEPKNDATRQMALLGFSDCWVETERQGTLETCR